jgi:hypothetical protein
MTKPTLPDWFWDDCFATPYEKARDTIRKAQALAQATGEPVLLSFASGEAATMKLWSQIKPKGAFK